MTDRQDIPGFSAVFQNIFLGVLSAIVILRLVMWKFFQSDEAFVKEDFSNILVAGAILLASLVVLAVKLYRGEGVRRSGFEWPIALWLLASGLSWFYSADPAATLKSLIAFFAYLLFFCLLVDALSTEWRIQAFLFILLGCALASAAFGIREFFLLQASFFGSPDLSLHETNRSLYYILTNKRVCSFQGWPNSLAGFLLLFLPCPLIYTFSARKIWHKFMAGTVFLVLLGCFLVTFSFLGWLSFLLSAIILAPWMWRAFGAAKWDRKLRIGLVSGCLVFLGLFSVVIANKHFLSSLTPRIQYYRSALALLQDKPWLGHGRQTFGTLMGQFAQNSEDLTAFVHNSYLQAWVETGILGFIGLLGIVAIFAVLSRRQLLSWKGTGQDWMKLALMWGLIAFFIDNLFSFTFLKPNLSLYGWAVLAVFAALVQDHRPPIEWGRSLPSKIGLVLLAGGVAFSLVLAVRMVEGFVDYREGAAARGRGDLMLAAAYYEQASREDRWESRYLDALGAVQVDIFNQTGKKEDLDKAEAAFLEAIRRGPNIADHYFLLSKIYEYRGDRIQAAESMAKVRLLMPYAFKASAATASGP